MVDNSDILHECWTACVGSLKHFWAQLLHSTKTTQQYNKDNVFRDTDTQSHTHTHTLVFTLGHAHTDLSNRWEWHYLQGLERRRPVGAEQEWRLATVQLHNEAQASCQQVLQMNIFLKVSKRTHLRFNSKNVKIRLLWLQYNSFINAEVSHEGFQLDLVHLKA